MARGENVSVLITKILIIVTIHAGKKLVSPTTIMPIGTREDKNIKLLEKILDVLGRYLTTVKEHTEKLIEGPLGFNIGKRIGASHLLREASFLTFRLTDEAIRIIESAKNGREFLTIVDNINRTVEDIYGFPRVRREEYQEELII